MTHIAFWVLVITCVLWLIWELIPDSFKAYMGYQRQLKRDKKEGKKGRYFFTWRINSRR